MKRNTWQREAVTTALAAQDAFVSAQQLHSVLRAEGTGIGLATVYRALADMAVGGRADSLQSAEGEALYRACTPGEHHHHLICRSCGQAEEIEAVEIEQWAKSIAASHGYAKPEHVVYVFGECPACTAAALI
ncbi:MAG: Fur family transcriptional regulator [Terrimesophilobacter sp.]